MTAPSKSTRPLLVHLPADLVEEVDALCAANYVNRTDFFVMALKLYLELHDVGYSSEDFLAGHHKASAEPVDDEEEQVLFAAEDD